jgi:hypothetical protein
MLGRHREQQDHDEERPAPAERCDHAARTTRTGEQSGHARLTNRTTVSSARSARRCDASRQPRPSQDRHTPEEFAMTPIVVRATRATHHVP